MFMAGIQQSCCALISLVMSSDISCVEVTVKVSNVYPSFEPQWSLRIVDSLGQLYLSFVRQLSS